MIYPYSISIDITYRCNFRCLHCYNCSGTVPRPELNDEQLSTVVKDLVRLKPHTLCFCGGETLLRKDIMFKLSKICKEISPVTSFNCVTNGYLLDEEVANEIEQAKMTLVQISLDGANANTHDWLRNKPGSFNRALNALSLLHERNIQTAVSFIPNRRNKNQVIEVADICERLGVSTLRVQPLMLLGRAKLNMLDEELTWEEYKNFYKHLETRKIENFKKGKMVIEIGDPIDHLLTTDYANNPYLPVNANGDIQISPYLPITVGNLLVAPIAQYYNRGLTEVWKNELVEFLAKNIYSPQKMDLSDRFSVPNITEKPITFNMLDEDFEEQTKEVLCQLKNKK